MATSPLPFPSATSILSSTSSIISQTATAISSLATATPDPTPVVPGPNDMDDDNDDPRPNNIMYYYFFVFLSVIIAILVLGCYAYSRRRRARRLEERSIAQNALERDLEGWAPGNRRANLFGRRRTDPDEGFNEFGEAPPVYKAKDDGVSSRATTGISSGSDDIAIPLQELPDYETIVKETAVSHVAPSQADGAGASESSAISPVTAHTPIPTRSTP